MTNNAMEKNWINIIQPFLRDASENDVPFFLFVEEMDDTVEFMMNIRNGDLFRAKKEDVNL